MDFVKSFGYNTFLAIVFTGSIRLVARSNELDPKLCILLMSVPTV